jgi:hypothetical protein
MHLSFGHKQHSQTKSAANSSTVADSNSDHFVGKNNKKFGIFSGILNGLSNSSTDATANMLIRNNASTNNNSRSLKASSVSSSSSSRLSTSSSESSKLKSRSKEKPINKTSLLNTKSNSERIARIKDNKSFNALKVNF